MEFTGAQPIEKRSPVFRGAHVYVQTARHEAFPTDLLCALACGCADVMEYTTSNRAPTNWSNALSEQKLTDALRSVADLPQMTENEEFARYDHRPVLEQYPDCYRDMQDSIGFF